MFTEDDYLKFRELRITHLANYFEEVIKDEANDALTPEGVFLTAVDEALHRRRAKRIDTMIRKARFAIPQASIAEIRYDQGRNLNPTRMRRYSQHDWSTDPTNLLILSATGGGKTYLACAIGIAACHNEHSVRYHRMDELAQTLAVTRTNSHTHQQVLRELIDADLLIIDDFLTVGIDQNTTGDLFAILASRDGKVPTVIASQSGPGYWVETIPDQVAADSIVNKLARSARRIDLGGVDMRELLNIEQRNDTDFWE